MEGNPLLLASMMFRAFPSWPRKRSQISRRLEVKLISRVAPYSPSGRARSRRPCVEIPREQSTYSHRRRSELRIPSDPIRVLHLVGAGLLGHPLSDYPSIQNYGSRALLRPPGGYALATRRPACHAHAAWRRRRGGTLGVFIIARRNPRQLALGCPSAPNEVPDGGTPCIGLTAVEKIRMPLGVLY
jgi:hypothetical protein